MGEYNDNENDNGENATQKSAERQEHAKEFYPVGRNDYNNLMVQAWLLKNLIGRDVLCQIR